MFINPLTSRVIQKYDKKKFTLHENGVNLVPIHDKDKCILYDGIYYKYNGDIFRGMTSGTATHENIISPPIFNMYLSDRHKYYYNPNSGMYKPTVDIVYGKYVFGTENGRLIPINKDKYFIHNGQFHKKTIFKKRYGDTKPNNVLYSKWYVSDGIASCILEYLPFAYAYTFNCLLTGKYVHEHIEKTTNDIFYMIRHGKIPDGINHMIELTQDYTDAILNSDELLPIYFEHIQYNFARILVHHASNDFIIKLMYTYAKQEKFSCIATLAEYTLFTKLTEEQLRMLKMVASKTTEVINKRNIELLIDEIDDLFKYVAYKIADSASYCTVAWKLLHTHRDKFTDDNYDKITRLILKRSKNSSLIDDIVYELSGVSYSKYDTLGEDGDIT